jgi:AraC-like DNA-binding protein
MVKDPEAALFQTVTGGEALRLLTGYIAALNDGVSLANPELRYIFATHVQDLVAVIIGATRDGAELARGRGVRAARLRALKADILANAGSRRLSLDAVAARLGISPIYIRKLLEGEDTSFTKFVLEQGLMRTYRMLNDPRFAGRPIAAIAMERGLRRPLLFQPRLPPPLWRRAVGGAGGRRAMSPPKIHTLARRA